MLPVAHWLALLFTSIPNRPFIKYLLPGLLLTTSPSGAQNRATPFSQTNRINLPGELNAKVLLQDREGFLWLGTRLGLHRFDGYSTRLIDTTPREGLRLADPEIIALHEDRRGRLWIGTGNGLHCLDRRRTAVWAYLVESDAQRKGKNAVTCVMEDSRGIIWCGTRKGVLYACPPGGRFRQVVNPAPGYPDGLFSDVVNLTEDREGTLWVATNQRGMYRMTATGSLLGHFPVSLVFASLGGKAGELPVINTEQELLTYEARAGQFVPLLTYRQLGVGMGEFRCLLQEGPYIWLQASFRLLRLHRGTRAIEDYTFRVTGSQAVDVNQVYADGDGNLWLGTTSGVFRVGHQDHYFTVLAPPAARPDGYFSTRGLLEYGGKLYVGSYQGFYAYDPQKQAFQEHRYWHPQVKQWLNPLAMALLEAPDGTFWVASEGNGLMQFDPRNGTFRAWKGPDGVESAITIPGSKAGNVYALLRDRRHRLWMGTAGGLFRVEPRAGNARPVFTEVNAGHLHEAKILALHESGDGTLWIGTTTGLYRQSAGGTITAHYGSDPGTAGTPRLPNAYIHCIYEDHQGNLWLGTRGGGVSVLDGRRGSVRAYTVEDGLANNVVYAVLPGPEGQLWMSTDGGLSRLDVARGRFLNFDVHDGLPDNEFNYSSALAGSGGKLYFGGLRGVVSLEPGRVRPRERLPRVKLTKLMQHRGASGRTTETSLAAGTLTRIALDYQDRFFTLHFALNDAYQTDKAQFAYRMEGVSPEWQYTGTANYIQFAGLPAGDYVLHLKGADRKGQWSPHPLSIPVHVGQAFYATVWAYLLYAGLLIAGGVAVFRFQWNRLRLRQQLAQEQREKDNLREVDRMKSQFFANIAHEFRTPLTLILGPAEKIMSQTAESPSRRWATQVQRNAAQLLGLVNQLLDLSKLDSGLEKLNLTEADAVPFVRDATTALQSLADQKGLTLHFRTGVEALPMHFDADKLQKILYNLLSNACTYTPAGGSITVSVSTTEPPSGEPGEWLELGVADTGIGIAGAHLPFLFDRYYRVPDARRLSPVGTGIGLALVKELVELHGGTIAVESTPGAGTTFTFRLPRWAKGAGTGNAAAPGVPLAPAVSTLPPPPTRDSLPGFPSGGMDDAEKPVVLVVEDHPGVRTFTTEVLHPFYQVLEAADGTEGIVMARERIPDLIISDVMMPVTDGYTLLHLVKTGELTCHIPVVLLTARNSRESRLEGLQTGADAYLSKPFQVQELLLTLRNLLILRQQIQRQFAGHGAVRTEAAPPPPPAPDDSFLQRFTRLVDEHLGDENFGVEEMVARIGMSRTQLHRKVKAVTGQSTGHLIRTMRLQRAAELLRHDDLSITDIAFRVGFSSASYFTESFHKHFGYPPSEGRKEKG